jgi:hypothetical protein
MVKKNNGEITKVLNESTCFRGYGFLDKAIASGLNLFWNGEDCSGFRGE